MANEKQTDMDARLKALEEQNLQLMEMLTAKHAAEQANTFTPAVLKEIVSGVAEAAAGPSQVLASKLKPENVDHLHVSPFEHPKGGLLNPKPPLTRELVWLGRVKAEDLTYAEVLAVNALNDTLARSQQRLARDGKWKASVSDDDKVLTITAPVKTIDDRQDLPAFIQIVQELTTGERVLEQADILTELALVKAELAKLQAVGA